MRRHALAGSPTEPEPLSAMNTTPLIDVLLVLLIMMILTIPAALNKVPLDLPVPGKPAARAVTHVLALDRAGRVSIDGAMLDEAALAARLKRIATVGDVVTMTTDPEARYERFAETLALVRGAGVTRLGFSPVAAD